MKCKKSTCLYFDSKMTDNCSRFEPPRVESCSFREPLKEQNKRLRDVIKAADDYLNTNNLTNIAHGSILHQQFKDALAE